MIKVDVDGQVEGDLQIAPPVTVDYTGCYTFGGNNMWHHGKVTRGSYWDGREFKLNGAKPFAYAAGGYGYLLSRKALQVLAVLDLVATSHRHIYEDIMVRHAHSLILPWQVCFYDQCCATLITLSRIQWEINKYRY